MFIFFYAAALLFALACLVIAVRILAKATLAPKLQSLFLDLAVLLCWFTVTNYLGNCLYLRFVGIFLFGDERVAQFLAVSAGWLAHFSVGAYLWLRFRRRSNERARSAFSLLVLLAMPVLLMALSTLWIPGGFEIYGLAAFIVGMQILAATFWKLARTAQPAF